jgi:hypothetical protein
MGSPASFLFSAWLVRALGQRDDAWRAPVLEDEMTAALAELARLDPDSAASRARSLIAVVSRKAS